jgi:AmiR/NasT family two-component response regulator
MIERLPTPWGLVRSGVAPDHPKIKTVSKVFEKIASEPNFRLFGNLELGKDISLADLTDRYDAVIMATGSAIGKKLGIPGEDLANSISAAQFVPWYNGHPDYADFKVDLSGKVAVVIGAGNVAMDCGRILAIDPKELDETDTADHAHQDLSKSNIRKVFITGRRGAEFAAFTAPELRDLPKLEHTDVYISEEAIALAQEFTPDLCILDVKMPILDGISAAEKIISIAPVCMLTAFSQRELVERARDAGVMAYVVKPFSISDLVPAIEIAISRHTQMKSLAAEVEDLHERLETRKVIDRAKGILMQALRISEPEAFSWIQRAAMDRRLTMKEVAEAVISPEAALDR